MGAWLNAIFDCVWDGVGSAGAVLDTNLEPFANDDDDDDDGDDDVPLTTGINFPPSWIFLNCFIPI